jgi:hypothetical protein
MLSRTESIDGFHLKLSRTEKELYEEFLKTEEAEILAEMQQYFAEAKQKAGGIRFDDQSLWSRIKSTVDAWIANARLVREVSSRAKRFPDGLGH